MRGSFRLAAILVACLGVGCATRAGVVFDERQDFSSYRTWDWLPSAERRVEAALGDPPVLEARLVRLVERAMEERGFERSPEAPQLRLSVYLGIRRQLVYEYETGAVESVHSFHDSPSYQIQATRREIRLYERGHLVIGVTDERQRRPVWRGEFHGRFRGHFWPHLEDAVTELLERLPPR